MSASGVCARVKMYTLPSYSLCLSLFPPMFCAAANCLPQCQNGGMCLRPQLCVCKQGFNGKACEQKTKPTSSIPAQPGNGHTNGHSIVPQRPIPQRPIPQQGYAPAPVPVSNMAQMTLTVKQSPHLIRPQQ